MACRSFFIDGRNSLAQSVVNDRSKPSVNLLPFFTFRVTSPTACVSAKFKSLLDMLFDFECDSFGASPFVPSGCVVTTSGAEPRFIEEMEFLG